MDFQELVEEVYLITKRRDLVARTESAIKAATLKAHHADFFYPDIVEVSIEFQDEAFIQNFNPTEILPRFRKAKYIRQWHGGVQGEAGKFLDHIQIENAFDSYNYIKTDVFYLAGQLIQIRTTTPLKRCLFGCYVHPVMGPEECKSWIAQAMPFTIIYEAARTIFKSIGMQSEAAEMAQLVAEQISMLRMSYVDDTPFT